MDQDRKPFTDYASRTRRRGNPERWGWIAAGILAAALLAALLLWAGAVGRERGLESLRTDLDNANAQLAAAREEAQTNQDFIASLQSRIADLQQQQQEASQVSKGLEDEMRTDLASRDVTISNLQGRLTVNILDRVMFDSGEATIKPDGEAVMRKVAAILAEHANLKIQVAGHTDDMPIRPEARARFASNWELSTARALAAVHFLTEKAGVDPRRVAAVGYGEYRPIADNATPEGRAQNRRIEIVVLPDEPANPLPAAENEAPTNSPPPSAATNP